MSQRFNDTGRGDRPGADVATAGTRWATRLALTGGGFVTLALLASTPALAQSAGQGFCETNMAQTILNMIRVVRLAGPLLGGLIAIGAVAVAPAIRSAEMKRELKDMRNRGVIWGVIVAPLGTTALQFLLTDIVAGASACGF